MVFQVVPFLWNSDAVESAPAGSMYVPHILPTDFVADFCDIQTRDGWNVGVLGDNICAAAIYQHLASVVLL